MKRFLITPRIRAEIKNHSRELLLLPEIRNRVKHLIYKNKSIRESDLDILDEKLRLRESKIDLTEIIFHPERNFGYKIPDIDFLGKGIELAEFIGILLGDGNLNNNNLRVILDVREFHYKKYVKGLFKKLFNCGINECKVKAKQAIVLYKSNKTIMDIIEGYGLKKGNKMKNDMGIPKWIKKEKLLLRWCLRGLIDTDGTVSFDKRDCKILVGFCSYSPKLLQDVKESLEKFGLTVAKCGKNHIRINRLTDVKAYVKLIGFSNFKYVQRYGCVDILWFSHRIANSLSLRSRRML